MQPQEVLTDGSSEWLSHICCIKASQTCLFLCNTPTYVNFMLAFEATLTDPKLTRYIIFLFHGGRFICSYVGEIDFSVQSISLVSSGINTNPGLSRQRESRSNQT